MLAAPVIDGDAMFVFTNTFQSLQNLRRQCIVGAPDKNPRQHFDLPILKSAGKILFHLGGGLVEFHALRRVTLVHGAGTRRETVALPIAFLAGRLYRDKRRVMLMHDLFEERLERGAPAFM